MRLFWPEYRFQRAWQITPRMACPAWADRTAAHDVDNTLTTHRAAPISGRRRARVDPQNCSRRACGSLVLSNNKPARVEPFAEMIGLGCIANAKNLLAAACAR